MRDGLIARHFGAAVLVVAMASCSGDGCACLGEVPGGFPDQARQQGAVQTRLSESGLDVINSSMSELSALVLDGDGPLEFPIPRDCASDPQVCCYVPEGSCRLRFDIEERAGDLPRLYLEPLSSNRVQLTIRARIRTPSALPVHTTGPLGGQISCWVYVDSTWSGYPHVTVRAVIALEDDPITGTLRGRVVSSTLAGITSGDVDISGGLLCGFGSTQDAADSMNAQLLARIPAAVEDLLCTTCDSGADCAPHGVCGSDGVCYLPGTGGRCLQRFGVSGRLAAATALGDLPTHAADAIDLYLTAGGGARATAGGLSLGVLAGARPATSVAAHECVPPAPEPPINRILDSTVLAGNRHPRSGERFDLGVGIHRQFLEHAAWAAQQAGFLCLDVGPAQAPLLSAEALSILAPSLIDLTHGEDAPLYLLIRPQQPPSLALGAGTIVDGSIAEPLIQLSMRELEVDFYAFIDQQYARILTLRADLDVPIALDIDGDGAVIPVLGDLADAFTNLRVVNSELLAEPADEIERRFPAVLSIALPAFSDALSSFEVPALAGMTLALRPGSFTSIENDAMLGIFGDLAPAATPARIAATATVRVLDRSADRVTLALGGSGGPLEWSVRLDGGFWSPYSSDPAPVIVRQALRLVGSHTLEVRAREIGEPMTTSQPVAVEIVTAAPPRVHRPIEFHGTGETGGGCDCRLGAGDGRAGGGLLVLLAIVVLGLSRRRWPVLLLASAVLLVGCSSSQDGDGGGDDLDPTVVHPGPTGRWASMAADDTRVLLAAYEQDFGDLVVATIDGEGRPVFRVVDGAPDGPVVLDPDGYRGGVNAPGGDVGAHTSIALAGGEARIAYQDLDRGALRYAREAGADWIATDVEVPGEGEAATHGLYASLATDGDGLPAIAYMTMSYQAPEGDDEAGAMHATLRLARAMLATPVGPEDWTVTVIDEATAPVVEGFEDLAVGTGLHASLGFASSGSAVIAFYRQVTGDLVLAVESDEGFDLIELDAGPDRDRGQYASLAIADDDTVHVAYQDALADRMLAVRYAAGAIVGPEVIDDGRRDGDRPHAVGASARLVLVGDTAVVAYQDGTTSDLMWAARTGDDGWIGGEVMTGELGYGFHIAAAAAGGAVWCSTYAYDPQRWPPGHTEVRRLEL
ncbi:MAG TPA: hypothetical protein VML75_25090 [Kofleriaceae bacterium]|nr:hypothetical protein [Kofleriaceae bacterium]